MSNSLLCDIILISCQKNQFVKKSTKSYYNRGVMKYLKSTNSMLIFIYLNLKKKTLFSLKKQITLIWTSF